MKKLINILNHNPNIDEWKIINNQTHSTELFFVKEKLQINRAKDVEKIDVTVYKHLGNNKFTGSSTVVLNPTDSIKEIDSKINKAVIAASNIKNQYFTLPKPNNQSSPEITSKFSSGDVVEIISQIVKDIYQEDNVYSAFINSAEFFINTETKRIINSNGIDVSYKSYQGLMELITEAKGKLENIELFNMIDFSDYDKSFIKDLIKEQLLNTSLRAKAIKMPNIKNIPVIIHGKAINDLWGYFMFLASASGKYQKMHDNNVGDLIQSKDALGDKLTISTTPIIKNSVDNSYYDNDGIYLEEINIIKDGVITRLTANNRYSQYFGINPTGEIKNLVINGGKLTGKELKQKPYLEVKSFSAFQTNVMTGFFGGEFRLAIYHDGEKAIPVTQGAVSGNISELKNEMFLSKETVQSRNIITPKLVKFNKMTIVGGN